MGKGFWPAFWMLPYPQHWPPEIDIFETIRDDPQIHMTYHWSDQGHKSSGNRWTEDGFSYSREFHTYGLLWEPDKIVWYIDGVERSRFTDAQAIVSEPMYLLINFGIDARWPGPCDATTPFPSYYECDAIRVYQRNWPMISEATAIELRPPSRCLGEDLDRDPEVPRSMRSVVGAPYRGRFSESLCRICRRKI